jgi:hypothetical protein
MISHYTAFNYVRPEVVTAMIMSNRIFWDVLSYSLIQVSLCFGEGGAYMLRFDPAPEGSTALQIFQQLPSNYSETHRKR